MLIVGFMLCHKCISHILHVNGDMIRHKKTLVMSQVSRPAQVILEWRTRTRGILDSLFPVLPQ